MRDLIVEAIKTSIKEYPEVVEYLEGYAGWYAGVLAMKAGEAPDDKQRILDALRPARRLGVYFKEQLERIIKEVKKRKNVLSYSFWINEERLLWQMLSSDFVSIIVHGTTGGINLLGAGSNLVNLDNTNRFLIEFARKYRDKWLHKITETSRETVEKIITEWLATGDPMSELVKTLSDPNLGIFSKARAERIATTEVTRLYAMGNKLAWEQAGITEFVWQTSVDELVCPICGERHNQTYPLSMLDDLPAHVNCRCSAKPVVNMQAFEDKIDRILAE